MLKPDAPSRFSALPAGIEAVVIGGSAGVVEALSVILRDLPQAYPLPIMVAVHLSPDSESTLVELFSHKSRMQVKEAEDKESIVKNTIYFAPPNYHLLVEPNRRLSLSSDEPVLYSRPSIDVLFESAADAYGKALLGIILTGANSDGASGLHAIYKSGGTVLVQNPKQAYASAMPEAALAACPGAHALSVAEIAFLLNTVPQPGEH